MRQVHIYLKHAQASDVLDTLKEKDGPFSEYIWGVADFAGSDKVLIKFVCGDEKLSYVMHLLDEMGVGELYGSIDVLPLSTTKPIKRDTRLVKKRKYILHNRLSTEEIFEIIDGDSHLTFDFLVSGLQRH